MYHMIMHKNIDVFFDDIAGSLFVVWNSKSSHCKEDVR